MFASKRVWIAALVLGLGWAATAVAAGVSGASALEFTRRAVALGHGRRARPRIIALQNYILTELQKDGCEIVEDAFTAKTPQGTIAMKNIIARFPGKGPAGLAAPSRSPGTSIPSSFQDANSWARAMAARPLDCCSNWLGFWRISRASTTCTWPFSMAKRLSASGPTRDSLYGSRHLAERWRRDGTLRRLKGLINVDMIGDKNLDIPQETNGNAALNKLMWNTAADLGYKAFFTEPANRRGRRPHAFHSRRRRRPSI